MATSNRQWRGQPGPTQYTTPKYPATSKSGLQVFVDPVIAKAKSKNPTQRARRMPADPRVE